MRGRPFRKGESGNPGGRPKVIADVRALARAAAPDAIEELAKLAIKAKSGTARVVAIRELLDRGYGKAQQVVENEDDLSDKTADELRNELLTEFANLFPDYRLVPAKPRNSLAEPKVRRLSFDRARDARDVD